MEQAASMYIDKYNASDMILSSENARVNEQSHRFTCQPHV